MACVGCRRPACLDCQAGTTVSGHVLCRDCAARAEAGPEQAAAAAPARRRLLAGTPALVWALIGLNVLAYAAQWLTLGRAMDLTALGWYAPVQTSTLFMEPHRLLTNAFLHSLQNPGHLVLNMLALWMLGRATLPRLGPARFLVLYLLSALGGSVAVLWLSDPLTPVLGASGAIYGLFGAVLVQSLRRRRTGDLRSVAVLLAVNLLFSLSVPGISWQGHLGGLLAGIAAAACVEAGGPARRQTRRTAGLQWAGLALVLAGLAVLAWAGVSRLTPAVLWAG